MPQLGESVQNSTRMFRIHNKNSGERGLAGWPATLGADSSQMPRHGLRWAGVEFSVSCAPCAVACPSPSTMSPSTWS
jgi:hypothetical protein